MTAVDSVPSDFQTDLSLAVSLGRKLTELHEAERQHQSSDRQEALFTQIQELGARYFALIEHLMTDHEAEMEQRVNALFIPENPVIQSTITIRREHDPLLVTQYDTGAREEPTQSFS
jgi:hypothetical protein